MTANGWFQIFVFLMVILAVAKPLGIYMARVFAGEKTFFDPLARPVERLLYRLTGVDEDREMRWTEYAISMLLFSAVSMLLLYVMQRVQHWLPWNTQTMAGVAPDLAWNTASSFTTNTNWQAYTPETTMTYFTQMAGLAYHNFMSAAAGVAMAIAVIRGIARKEKDTIGNFWVDLTRCTLWVLLPICLVVSLIFVSQGMVQNLKSYDKAQLVNPQTVQQTGADGKTTTEVVSEQTIAQGPVASQEAIKIFGTNGGGFFNANSAHPFENPTPLTNFLQLVLIFAIPSGLTYTLGRMTGSQQHGWAVWTAMALLFVLGAGCAYAAEARERAAARCGPKGERDASGREHGRQGSAVRDRGFGALCHGDDGRELRGGELDARFVHAAGRDGSNGEHDAGRGRVRRSGGGTLRDYRVRDSFGIHRGIDGGKNSGVPGKENRSVRRKDGHAHGAGFFAGDFSIHGHWRGESGREGRYFQSRSARAFADFVCVHGRGSEQRFGVCGRELEFGLVQHDHRIRHADWKILHGHPGAGDCGKPGA